MNLFKVVPWVPIAILVIMALILYGPAFSGVDPLIPYANALDFFLTFAITLFAAVEGYSTYMQVELSQNRNLIEDAKNELETVYGPLYTLLNQQSIPGYERDELCIIETEKAFLDKTLAKYPFMFPSDIYDLWRKSIHDIDEKNISQNDMGETWFKLPLKFRDRINEEYVLRVEKYNKLLKK